MRPGSRNSLIFLIVFVLIFAGCKREETTGNNLFETESAYSEWIKENNNPILSLTSDDFEDLQFLKPLLETKRIVQLGESGHGVKEFNLVKVRLIKFLHREMGFDVIAFESSIFGCFYANRNIPSMNAEEVMRNSIFAVWQTEEVLPLFDYIRETYDSERPLILAGFDTQISSRVGVANRPSFLKDVIAAIDPVYAEEVYNIDYNFVDTYLSGGYDSMVSYAKENKDALIRDYENMVTFLDTQKSLLLQAYPGEPEVPLIARQTAWSAIRFINQICSDNYDISGPIRDEGMADNVEYLLNEVYPGKKIINWAHNAHIRHNNNETTSVFLYPGVLRMGTWIAERHPDELYTIGIYMHQGKAADNSRSIYVIPPTRSIGHLSYILSLSGEEWCFVDLENQIKTSGNSWMFEEIFARAWGMQLGALKMVLKNQYNGILFINNVNPPDYLPYSTDAVKTEPIPNNR